LPPGAGTLYKSLEKEIREATPTPSSSYLDKTMTENETSGKAFDCEYLLNDELEEHAVKPFYTQVNEQISPKKEARKVVDPDMTSSDEDDGDLFEQVAQGTIELRKSPIKSTRADILLSSRHNPTTPSIQYQPPQQPQQQVEQHFDNSLQQQQVDNSPVSVTPTREAMYQSAAP